MEENSVQPGESGLSDDLNLYIQNTRASAGQRFVNWLIDNLLMRFGLSYLTGTVVGFGMAKLFPEYTTKIIYSSDQSELILIGLIIVIFNYLTYYTFLRKSF
jgi:hypothetical protein